MERKRLLKLKRPVAGLLFLALMAIFVLRMNDALLPTRTGYGATWNMYLQEKRDSIDLLFFGSSVVYCDVIPAQIYSETGLTSYVMAGPEQTYSLTYAYMKEALKTQSPSYIFLEITGILFDRYQNYTKVNVSYMPYCSINRLEAILCGAEPKERFGLIFPLYNYHDRWEEIDFPLDLFRKRSDEKVDPYAGATIMMETRPQEERGEREYQIEETVFRENTAYLQKMQSLCKQKGIQLILFQAPSCQYIPEAWMARIRSVTGSDVPVVDFNQDFDKMNLNINTDFYDFLHCNLSGAIKFNRVLSAYIKKTCSIQSHPHDYAVWKQRTNMFDQMVEQWSAM